MASYNFGFVGSAIEAAKHADASINAGSIALPDIELVGGNFADFIMNADRIFTVEGSSTDFIWGQAWGNSQTRVTK